MRLNDIIDSTPGAHRSFIDFADNTGRFVLGYKFDPHGWLSLLSSGSGVSDLLLRQLSIGIGKSRDLCSMRIKSK
jgi:hypothetical protein